MSACPNRFSPGLRVALSASGSLDAAVVSSGGVLYVGGVANGMTLSSGGMLMKGSPPH